MPSLDARVDGECPADEIAFTQQMGCQNDGSVEFCVPKADAALQDRLRDIAATITFMAAGGRARCDTATQLLGMYPLALEHDCAEGSAMADAVWADMCRIASEPAVMAIVPTWFE